MEPEVPAAEMPKFLQDIYAEMGGSAGYEFTPEDLALLGQYAAQQGMQQQFGQMGLANRQMDLTEAEIDQKYQEFEFMRDQYFPWYTGDYFDFQKQQAANELQMSNDDVKKSANYLQQARSQTEAAQYGAQAAKAQLAYQMGILGSRDSAGGPRQQAGPWARQEPNRYQRLGGY